MPGRSGQSYQHSFAMVPQANIQRSAFDRSHSVKTTFDFGYLIPIYVDEALPGDTFNLRLNTFGRLAPMVNPVFENLWLDYFFFAVPNRLLWINWVKLMGERSDPADPGPETFAVPTLTPQGAGFAENSVADYFGLPTKVSSAPLASHPSALPFRAYALIWNEWFRDENLQVRTGFTTANGPDSITSYPLLRRGKRHDYFTAALPTPQKGPNVTFPIAGTAPVVAASPGARPQFQTPAPPTAATWTGGVDYGTSGVMTFQTLSGSAPAVGSDIFWNAANTGLVANLNPAFAVSVNMFREAVATQHIFERDMRGGTRYTETIRAHFGVTSPDARMQRPEYLGGGSTRINVNPVVNTSTNADPLTPAPPGDPKNYLGGLGAYGTTSANGIGFSKSFTEHCTIIGLCSARADLTYQQGIERMWSRRNRFDFYWPDWAHLGEQPVKNKEIFQQASGGGAINSGTNDEDTFGFQERYAEYRYKPSRVTGRFRSNATTPLHSWHMAQEFSALPALNATFIEENPPVGRALVVVSGEPHVLLDAFFNLRCVRPMPIFATPGLRRM